jgi:hypothetical protein
MSTNVDDTSYAAALQAVQQRYRELEQRFESLVEVQDLWVRTIRNTKMTFADKLLYIALVDTYPGLLEGLTLRISVCLVRENAGWIAKNPAGNFFQDMQTIGALVYNPGVYEKKTNERMGTVIPLPDKFPYPETFDLKSVEKRRKAREEQSKKNKEMQAAWRTFQCEACGSIDIRYDLIPLCGSCRHKHEAVKDIEASRITIADAEEGDESDAWEASDPKGHPSTESIPPLRCHKCGNVRVDQWKKNLLRNRWQCIGCNSFAPFPLYKEGA